MRRYMGVVIRGVKVGPSPDWLVERLESVGSRSINNVVDATNYVLHELGQPMHAFDLAKLGGAEVAETSSCAAKAGETLMTLDGVDAQAARRDDRHRRRRASAGDRRRDGRPRQRGRPTRRRTSSSRSRTSIPRRIRDAPVARSASRPTRATASSAVSTSRSRRSALERVAQTHHAARRRKRRRRARGSLRTFAEAGATREHRRPPAARLRSAGDADQRRRSRGTARAASDSTSDSRRRSSARHAAVLATRRVARGRSHRGGRAPERVRQLPDWRCARSVRALSPTIRAGSRRSAFARRLSARGCSRLRPMPFVAGGAGFARVMNPLAENEAYLRRDVLDTLARRAEYNLAHMQGNVRLFEIGSAFEPRGGRLPVEELRVGALVMGRREPPHFTDPKSPEFAAWAVYDAWDVKALSATIARAAYPGAEVEVVAKDEKDLWESRHRGARSPRRRALGRHRERSCRGTGSAPHARRAGVGVAGVRRGDLAGRDVVRRRRAGGEVRVSCRRAAERGWSALHPATVDAGVRVRSRAVRSPTAFARPTSKRSCGACPESCSKAWNCSTSTLALELNLGIEASRGG